MKFLLPLALVSTALSACSVNTAGGFATKNAKPNEVRSSDSLTQEERHRLYSAALALSDSPLESETFKEVCKTIGIFDAGGAPNDNYLPFVAAHVDWVMKDETALFKQEIRTKEGAREYVNKHLPGVRP